MFSVVLMFGIAMSPMASGSMALQQAKAQLQFIEGQIEAKQSVEASAKEYARILEQIATTRDKAAQVLSKERIDRLLEAAQQARWNAAQMIISDERKSLYQHSYGSLVSGRVTTVKRGR
jgi:hypothetical protein